MTMSVIARLVAAGIFATSAASTAHAQDGSGRATVEQRLRGLELKTDYFKKTNRKITKNFSRTSAGPRACGFETGVILDPKITLGGISYAWMTATVQYSGNPGNIEMNFAPVGFGFPCNAAKANVAPSGTATLKKFCSFDVEKGDKYRVTFLVGRGETCDVISDVALELKLTNIEVIEPE
jgi:hypothetical protein